MTELPQGILDRVRECLGADRLAGAIIYLDSSPKHAGERLALGDATIDLPWDAHVAFVDLEPGVNWGHACCYLVIPQDAGEVIQVAAHQPPFLKAGEKTFHFLWRGPLAPEWAVVAETAATTKPATGP